MKKAVFFTLGLSLMASVVLVLALLIYHNTALTEERFADLGKLERLHDLESSVQKSLRDLFNRYSAITIVIDDDSVTFEEKLPNRNATTFNYTSDSFTYFIERNTTNIQVNLNKTKEKLPLLVLPHDIIYQHENFGEDTIRVIPSKIDNINGYDMRLKLDDWANETACVWDTTPGTFEFSLDITDRQDQYLCDDTFFIDPTVKNTFKLYNFYGNGVINVTIEDNGNLTIKSFHNLSVARTKLLLNESKEKKVKVVYEKGTARVIFDELDMRWDGYVRIA